MNLVLRLNKLVRGLGARNRRWRRALRYGVAPGLEHLRILRLIGPKVVVVDIGANRGQFALVARHCFPAAMIFSFEPLPVPAEIFRRVFANDEKVRLYSAAIGNQLGSAKIHVSMHDDSSSLLPITALQNRLFPGTAETEKQTIKIGRLDDFLTPDGIVGPALLKLDVQGYELEALQGCDNLLDCFAHVYAECSFVELYEGQALADEVITWLRERGFALRGVYDVSYDAYGKAIQADFMFSRD